MRRVCDDCGISISKDDPKESRTYSHSVCIDVTPGFKEYEHFCGDCIKKPTNRDQEPMFDHETAILVMNG